MEVMTILKEKTVFTEAPRVIILALLTVVALTRTDAFAPTPASLTSDSAVRSTAMVTTRSPSALLAKNTSFRYCSLTGTVIAKKKTTAAAGRQKKIDVRADDRVNKDRVAAEAQQPTVHGTAGHDDRRGRLTTGTGAALTWHTIVDHDEDEPHHESQTSSSRAAFGWDHQEWYVSLDDRSSFVCL
jgi:hypothetical protein